MNENGKHDPMNTLVDRVREIVHRHIDAMLAELTETDFEAEDGGDLLAAVVAGLTSEVGYLYATMAWRSEDRGKLIAVMLEETGSAIAYRLAKLKKDEENG